MTSRSHNSKGGPWALQGCHQSGIDSVPALLRPVLLCVDQQVSLQWFWVGGKSLGDSWKDTLCKLEADKDKLAQVNAAPNQLESVQVARSPLTLRYKLVLKLMPCLDNCQCDKPRQSQQCCWWAVFARDHLYIDIIRYLCLDIPVESFESFLYFGREGPWKLIGQATPCICFFSMFISACMCVRVLSVALWLIMPPNCAWDILR